MVNSQRRRLFATGVAILGTLAITVPAAAAPSFDPIPPVAGDDLLPDFSDAELEEILDQLEAFAQQRDPDSADGESAGDEGAEAAADQPMTRMAAPQALPQALPIEPPDPLDFDSIVADPDDYMIPGAAEQFRSGDGYLIPRPTPTGSGAGVIPAGLEDFYNQTLTWQDCAGFNAGFDDTDVPGAVCTYVIAPMDYADPAGPTIALAISKAPATSGSATGSLITDPGGPGSPGLDMVAYGLFGGVEDAFNIIGMDPRGVGASLPQIRCQSNDAWDRQRQGSDELTTDEANSVLKYNTDECYAWTGAAFGMPDVMDHVGTVNVVKDVDLIKSVLGDDQLNYLGFSYGSLIGYEYARQFPDSIRALVIDGIVDVLETNPDEKARYTDFIVPTSGNSTVTQIAGFQATFEQFLGWCAELGQDCALVDPDGENATADLLERYRALATAAWGGQTYLNYDGRVLSYEDFTQGTIMAMYTSQYWEFLNDGLWEVQVAPDDTGWLMALSDAYAGRDSDGDYGLDLAAFPSIMCNDYGTPPGFNDDLDAQISFLEDYYAAAPFLDPRTAEFPERGMEPSNDWCTYYQSQFTLPQAETMLAMPNVLVISTTYDPATPFDQGVVAAAVLGGTLLTVAGNEHTSYGWSECATATTDEYIRTLTVPTDFTGDEKVSTKDLHSTVITGDECMVATDFRPATALASGAADAGGSAVLTATGLVRNSEYVITWDHGSVPLSSDVTGAGTATVEVPADIAAGEYPLVLTPGIPALNDPAIRAEATLTVTAVAPPGDGDGDTDVDADGTDPDADADADADADGDGANTPGTDADGTDTPPATTAPGDNLPGTGANVTQLALIGVVVLLAGGLILVVVRRRGRSQ